MRFVSGTTLVLLASGASVPAHLCSAADYPSRAIRMIVPFAPGGSTDIVARITSGMLAETFKQPVVVENRPGGGTVIAMQAVATATPDGYTLLFGSSALANYPSLYKKLVLDVQRDLAPITLVVSGPYLVAVHPSLPVRSVAELIALAKAKPGQLNIGSAGSGSANHLAGELFKSVAGVNIVHVQYKGGGPSLVAAMAGETQLIIEPIISARGYVNAGKLRALAVTSDQRSSALPDLPTAAENGLPGYEASYWVGVHGPAGTPKDVIAKLSTTIAAIIRDAQVKTQLAAQGVEPIGNNPVEFAARIAADIEKWGKVIRDAGVPPE
jgi:tripartite-type tricarboxylate transporter receptor subunit TctC